VKDILKKLQGELVRVSRVRLTQAESSSAGKPLKKLVQGMFHLSHSGLSVKKSHGFPHV